MEKSLASANMNGMYDLQQHQQFQPVVQASIPRSTSGNICPVCSKSFDRMYNLKVHFRKHTGETPYSCPVHNCSKQFRWRSSMAHHVRAHHDASETAGISLKTSTDANGSKPATRKTGSPKRSVLATHPVSDRSGIKKSQRKRKTKTAKKRQNAVSPSAPRDSVTEPFAQPESPPLLSISDDPTRQDQEYGAVDPALFDIFPDDLSGHTGQTEILESVDGLPSSDFPALTEDPLDENANVMLFLVSSPDDAQNEELESIARDATLRAAIEAVALPVSQYNFM